MKQVFQKEKLLERKVDIMLSVSRQIYEIWRLFLTKGKNVKNMIDKT